MIHWGWTVVFFISGFITAAVLAASGQSREFGELKELLEEIKRREA